MTKKLLITLSILTLFANATKASDNNSATEEIMCIFAEKFKKLKQQ